MFARNRFVDQLPIEFNREGERVGSDYNCRIFTRMMWKNVGNRIENLEDKKYIDVQHIGIELARSRQDSHS
jgi:hypothetical protein